MRKKIVLLLLTVLVMSGALSSCGYAEVLDGDYTGLLSQKEVRFSSNVVVPTYSSSLRIVGHKWESGDAIGVYMLDKNSYAVVAGNNNVMYSTEYGGSTGNFVAHNGKVFFPANGREVRFMLYHPYSDLMSGSIYKVDVSNQTRQSDIDLLYSFDASATYDSNIEIRRVPVDFKRQLAKIYINVKNGEGLQGYDLMRMKVYITGLNTKADFSLLTGKLSNTSGISPITPSVLIAGGGNVYSGEAIVIPSSEVKNARIVLDLNNGKGSFAWNINERSFEKGKKYTYNITVTQSGITVDSKINNWHSIGMETEV